MSNYPKPLLKWVGGKSKLLDKIHDRFPSTIANYHEAFVGGGSVLFSVLYAIQQGDISLSGNVYAYDKNEVLIEFYKCVQANKEALWTHIQSICEVYNGIKDFKGTKKPEDEIQARQSKESYYFWLRKKYNKLDVCVEKCALFLIINKTCWRGVFRESGNGFNVPFGNYKTPLIIKKEDIDSASSLISNVKFAVMDCSEILRVKYSRGDFVYLDPPYAPETESSFVGYTKDGFDLEKHRKLFADIKSIKKIKFLMSNARTELVGTHFPADSFNVTEFEARRAINSKNPESVTFEVLISNF